MSKTNQDKRLRLIPHCSSVFGLPPSVAGVGDVEKQFIFQARSVQSFRRTNRA